MLRAIFLSHLRFGMKLTPNSTLQKLVELIAALQTSPETMERAKAFAIACGKGALLALITAFTRTRQPHFSRFSCLDDFSLYNERLEKALSIADPYPYN